MIGRQYYYNPIRENGLKVALAQAITNFVEHCGHKPFMIMIRFEELQGVEDLGVNDNLLIKPVVKTVAARTFVLYSEKRCPKVWAGSRTPYV